MRRFIFALTCVLTTVANANISADAGNHDNAPSTDISNAIQPVIKQALTSFHTPGMAVAVVHENQVVFFEGFGHADVAQQHKVTPNTYFRIASLSKAFTTAALAILVDDNKINWHDKVVDHLPAFTLYNPYVTQEFTILDLLTHKSGLASGAGDSMIWPQPSGFSVNEIIHNIRYLQPQYGFREQYAYSNVMYITAGEIIAKVSGESYAKFLQSRIFTPLNMQCFGEDIPSKAIAKTALPYGHTDTQGIFAITRNKITQKGVVSAAAGGIVCDLRSMTNWLKSWLSPNTLPFSDAQYAMLTRPHTLLRPSDNEQKWNNTLFKHYGLGWRISNIENLKVISHTGTVSGFQSYMLFFPELDLGVVIMNNGSHSGARSSVMQAIVHHYLSEYKISPSVIDDWVLAHETYYEELEQKYLNKLAIPVASAPMTIRDDDIMGRYVDPWFGGINIYQQDNILKFAASKMPNLIGTLTPFQDTHYKITWDDSNVAGDALITFTLNIDRQVTEASLYPFTSRTLTNHSYRDMRFVKDTQ